MQTGVVATRVATASTGRAAPGWLRACLDRCGAARGLARDGAVSAAIRYSFVDPASMPATRVRCAKQEDDQYRCDGHDRRHRHLGPIDDGLSASGRDRVDRRRAAQQDR